MGNPCATACIVQPAACKVRPKHEKDAEGMDASTRKETEEAKRQCELVATFRRAGISRLVLLAGAQTTRQTSYLGSVHGSDDMARPFPA